MAERITSGDIELLELLEGLEGLGPIECLEVFSQITGIKIHFEDVDITCGKDVLLIKGKLGKENNR